MTRIGMFLNLCANDPEVGKRQDAFKEGVGRDDVEYVVEYGEGKYREYPQIAQRLVDHNPDLLVATCGPTFWALQQQQETQQPPSQIPILFTTMIDPERTGRRIGPKSRGIASYRVTLSIQWLRLLQQMAPHIRRVAVVADFHANRPAAREEMVEIVRAAGAGAVADPIDLNNEDIAGPIAAFANGGNGGLIVPTGTLAGVRRTSIIELARTHRLPAIYGNRLYVESGGLFSYGPPTLALYKEAGKRAARILNNEPTPPPLGQAEMNERFELVINRSAAAAIGLTVPQQLLAQADEVIDGG